MGFLQELLSGFPCPPHVPRIAMKFFKNKWKRICLVTYPNISSSCNNQNKMVGGPRLDQEINETEYMIYIYYNNFNNKEIIFQKSKRLKANPQSY